VSDGRKENIVSAAGTAPAGTAPAAGNAAADEAATGSARPSIRVEVPAFQGPLDLLLHLIQRDEIDIYDIPIAHITRQYLEYLEIFRELDLEVAGEYILMAATLLRIKAQMLLPKPPDEPEEEDPRGVLVAALLEYQQFREAAGVLHGLESDARRRYVPPGDLPARRVEEVLIGTASVYDLVAALGDLLRRSVPSDSHQVFAERYHVEDQVAVIRARLESEREFLLSHLVGERPVRGLLVATFLALLELGRLQAVLLEQAFRYRDILIRRAPATAVNPAEADHEPKPLD
jgi:segregation and condensation protein A